MKNPTKKPLMGLSNSSVQRNDARRIAVSAAKQGCHAWTSAAVPVMMMMLMMMMMMMMMMIKLRIRTRWRDDDESCIENGDDDDDALT